MAEEEWVETSELRVRVDQSGRRFTQQFERLRERQLGHPSVIGTLHGVRFAVRTGLIESFLDQSLAGLREQDHLGPATVLLKQSERLWPQMVGHGRHAHGNALFHIG